MSKNNPKLDLVFMDLMIPKVSGLDATRQIRKFNKQIHIVALTANALEADKELCRSAGLDFHLSKPVSLKELKDTLVSFLDK